MAEVAALILAAGASTRFGSRKQLAPVGERTMLEAVVATAASELSPVLVVGPTGLPVPPDAVPVINDQPELGLSHSLRLGVAAVPPESTAAMILLGDQPTMPPTILRSILAARGEHPIVAAAADGLIGPPVLIERGAFGIVQKLSGDIGLREVIRQSDADVQLVDIRRHPPDVDTPEDLARLVAEQRRAVPSVDELKRRRDGLRRWLLDQAAAGVERIGDWTLPVTVAHLARWDGVAAAELARHFAGQRTSDYSDFQAWNRRWATEDADLSCEEALQRWDAAFALLIEIVHRTPAEDWDSEALAWLNGCTLDHYADHLPAV